jgi:hypothetical protein
MNLRHAAALALVGWYLMTPLARNGKVVLGVPLTQWSHWDSFDSSLECRNAGLDLMKRQEDRGNQNLIASADAFECIATDDPRLKQK